MPSQPEAQGDILKEFREGTFLSSLDRKVEQVDVVAYFCDDPIQFGSEHINL